MHSSLWVTTSHEEKFESQPVGSYLEFSHSALEFFAYFYARSARKYFQKGNEENEYPMFVYITGETVVC